MALVGILVQLAVSWILLYIFTRKHLFALGITPVGKRLSQLVTGFLFTGILCASIQLLDSALTGTRWELATDVSFMAVAEMLWWNVKSVVFEELLFRGALLYIVIQKFGSRLGIGLSAVVFGMYHWFSFGVFGSIMPMVVVFFMTALTGLVWAYAFSETKSIALPIGLHLGWNFTFNSVFSNGPLGEQIFVRASEPVQAMNEFGLLTYFVLPNVIVPLLTYVLVKFFYARRASKEELEQAVS